jgi:hypothetical protein
VVAKTEREKEREDAWKCASWARQQRSSVGCRKQHVSDNQHLVVIGKVLRLTGMNPSLGWLPSHPFGVVHFFFVKFFFTNSKGEA